MWLPMRATRFLWRIQPGRTPALWKYSAWPLGSGPPAIACRATASDVCQAAASAGSSRLPSHHQENWQVLPSSLCCETTPQMVPGKSRLRIRLSTVWAMASWPLRSEEHTSELQSLMRISYAVFCLNKKQNQHETQPHKRHLTP